MAQQTGRSNGLNSNGSLMNVGNTIWDRADGGRPSIRLHPEHSSGVAMAALLADGAEDPADRQRAPSAKETEQKMQMAPGAAHAVNESRVLSQHKGASWLENATVAPCTRGKPKLAVCGICGGEFGTASIEIHTRQCEKKLKAVVSKAQQKQTKSSKGSNAQSAVKVSLPKTVACPICKRSFGPTSIGVHVPLCREKHKNSTAVLSPRRPFCVPRSPPHSPRVSVFVPELNLHRQRQQQPEALREEMTSARVCRVAMRCIGQRLQKAAMASAFARWAHANRWRSKLFIRLARGLAQRQLSNTFKLWQLYCRHSMERQVEMKCILMQNASVAAAFAKWVTLHGSRRQLCTHMVQKRAQHGLAAALGSWRRRASDLAQRRATAVELHRRAANAAVMAAWKSVRRARLQLCDSMLHALSQKRTSEAFNSWRRSLLQAVTATKAAVASAATKQDDHTQVIAEVERSFRVHAPAELEIPPDWSEDSLQPCSRCGRTFLPDRLDVHMRACRVGVGGIKVFGPGTPPRRVTALGNGTPPKRATAVGKAKRYRVGGA